MDGTILVADDDRTIRTVLTQALTRAGCKVHATASLMTLMRWVEEGLGDLVISDVIMPDGNGLDALPRITRLRPGLPVIVISAQNTIMTAIQATEAEAFDYLPKPFDLPDLMKRCAKALEMKRPAPKTIAPPKSVDDLPLVGRTAVMQALYLLIARVMNADIPVIIQGESGVGKSLVAKALHDFSDRRARPFVVAGAADLAGGETISALMARSKGGSVLFDELGDFDAEAQARLVRMLDAQGDDGPRFMASSQTDLFEALETGRLRKDLYFRLNGVLLTVPPLRERIEDIALLTEHFLNRLARENGIERRRTPEAMTSLRANPWPGNVRQLEGLLRRLAVTSTEAEVSRAEVEQAMGRTAAPVGRGEIEGERLQASVARHVQRYFDLHDGQLPPAGVYERILREIEVPLLEIALDATAGNQARCADLLGINRNTLRKKITLLDIPVTRRRKLM